MTTDSRRFETLALHGGSYRADPATGAIAVPIYQTTSFQFQDTDHASRLFALGGNRQHLHARRNPTDDALENASRRSKAASRRWRSPPVRPRRPLGAEPGARPATISSRPPTSTAAPGHCSRSTLKQFGVEARFVDPSDPENFRRATDARTRAYYARVAPESEAERLPDRRGRRHRPLARHAAHRRQHRRAADVRPFEHGAAVVVYSATKYIGGHGTSIGGADHRRRQFSVGRFTPSVSAAQPARPELSRRASGPQPAKPLGPIAYVLARPRRRCCATSAPALSPLNAFQLLQGLETLPLRIAAPIDNAQAVADFLASASRR